MKPSFYIAKALEATFLSSLRDVRGRGGGILNVTMTLIFLVIVWTSPLNCLCFCLQMSVNISRDSYAKLRSKIANAVHHVALLDKAPLTTQSGLHVTVVGGCIICSAYKREEYHVVFYANSVCDFCVCVCVCVFFKSINYCYLFFLSLTQVLEFYAVLIKPISSALLRFNFPRLYFEGGHTF